MTSRGVALIAAGVALAVAAGATAYGLSTRSSSKGGKGQTNAAKTTRKKPPPLTPVCVLDVEGTLTKEFPVGDTQVVENYTLTTVLARKDGSDPQGAYKGSGLKGTIEGTGTQKTFNSRSEYKGNITGGSIAFSLTDNGYGSLSGQGTMSLKSVVSGTATGKYGKKPIPKYGLTSIIAITVTVEGSGATVKAKGGYGILTGEFRSPKQ